MPTPTYSQLITLSSTANGLISESIEERILTIMAMLASGQNPDGTATPAVAGGTTWPPCTVSSGLQNSAAPLAGVSYNHVFRSMGVGTIGRIVLQIGASSGNVAFGIYQSTGGVTLPTTRLTTSGLIPCPAAGVATVPLGSSVTVDLNCYFAIYADNTTATFFSFGNVWGGGYDPNHHPGAGLCLYDSASLTPNPATPNWNGASRSIIIVMEGFA
jgi:hypothetical protein